MGPPQDVYPPQTGVHSEVRERAEWAPLTRDAVPPAACHSGHLFLAADVPPRALVWHLRTRRGRTLVPFAANQRPESAVGSFLRLAVLPTLLLEARR
jgi:hypothetical protein